MPTPRAQIDVLALSSTPSNYKKAVRLRENKPDLHLNDPEIIQQLLNDAREQYEIAHADVEKRGTVIETTRYTSKGKAYEIEELNPYYRVAAKLAGQISRLTLMLARLGPKKDNGPKPGSAAAMFPEVFETQGQPS